MEKLTLFELHFDGAQFGPRNLGDDADDGATEDVESEQSGGRRVLRLVAASILFSLIATAIARRFAGDDSEIGIEEDVEDISIDPIEAE